MNRNGNVLAAHTGTCDCDASLAAPSTAVLAMLSADMLAACSVPEDFDLQAAWAANDFGQLLRSIRKSRLEPLEAELKRKRMAADAVKKCVWVLVFGDWHSQSCAASGSLTASVQNSACYACAGMRMD